MDSGHVMRATKADMKKPFERQNMSLLTSSLMAFPPGLSETFWAGLEESESFKMHQHSTFSSNLEEGITEMFLLCYEHQRQYMCLSFIDAV